MGRRVYKWLKMRRIMYRLSFVRFWQGNKISIKVVVRSFRTGLAFRFNCGEWRIDILYSSYQPREGSGVANLIHSFLVQFYNCIDLIIWSLRSWFRWSDRRFFSLVISYIILPPLMDWSNLANKQQSVGMKNMNSSKDYQSGLSQLIVRILYLI